MSSDRLENDNRWVEFRAQMPVSNQWAYFDHAAVAPLPLVCQQALSRWAEQATYAGDTQWPTWHRGVEEARRRAARLITADVSEVALVHNTTEGISLVAEGFPWRQGDNVVIPENEFPSNVYPWLNLASRGVETRRVPTNDGRLDLDRLQQACDARTKIIAASWVGYLSGWRADLDALAEMAHRAGALLLVDAIQGLGVFPLSVADTPIDFLAADGHKWMLGPEGAGLLYVRRQHLDLLRPIGVGWHSVEHEADYGRIEPRWKPSAARYEGGSQNMAGFLGLSESLQWLIDCGQPALAERILWITDLACERLQQAGATLVSHRQAEHRSGIVAFELAGQNALEVKHRCLKAGVVMSARGGKLRISPHAYNNADDIDRLIDALSL